MCRMELIGQANIWKKCCNLLSTTCHYFITGSTGCGKTTLAKELLRKYSKDNNLPINKDNFFVLTPDQDRGIQTVRNHLTLFIRQFAINPTIQRWVFIDDCDSFPQISQQALRRPMETHSHNTRFIFVGNSEDDLIPAIRSRCIHIKMNDIDPFYYRDDFVKLINISPIQLPFFQKETTWIWILNVMRNNIGDMVRFLRLLKDMFEKTPELTSLNMRFLQTISSTPNYNDFNPLLSALKSKNSITGVSALIRIWKKGYTYEDILESLQIIQGIFGENNLYENTIINIFLINAWINYCKGQTTLLGLINSFMKTIAEQELLTLFDKDTGQINLTP